jgi:hypothetical protein
MWRIKPVAASQSETDPAQKPALFMNRFRARIRLHAERTRMPFRARILVNAGQGYHAVKNRRARMPARWALKAL